MNIIGENISRLRKSLGLSQSELGRQANVSHVSINHIEINRTRDTRLSTIQKIAGALKVDIYQLIYAKKRKK